MEELWPFQKAVGAHGKSSAEVGWYGLKHGKRALKQMALNMLEEVGCMLHAERNGQTIWQQLHLMSACLWGLDHQIKELLNLREGLYDLLNHFQEELVSEQSTRHLNELINADQILTSDNAESIAQNRTELTILNACLDAVKDAKQAEEDAQQSHSAAQRDKTICDQAFAQWEAAQVTKDDKKMEELQFALQAEKEKGEGLQMELAEAKLELQFEVVLRKQKEMEVGQEVAKSTKMVAAVEEQKSYVDKLKEELQTELKQREVAFAEHTLIVEKLKEELTAAKELLKAEERKNRILPFCMKTMKKHVKMKGLVKKSKPGTVKGERPESRSLQPGQMYVNGNIVDAVSYWSKRRSADGSQRKQARPGAVGEHSVIVEKQLQKPDMADLLLGTENGNEEIQDIRL